MLEEIKAKMDLHVKSILGKNIITNDEYMLIKLHMERLEFEESQRKAAAEKEKYDEKFNALMATLVRGGFNGM